MFFENLGQASSFAFSAFSETANFGFLANPGKLGLGVLVFAGGALWLYPMALQVEVGGNGGRTCG